MPDLWRRREGLTGADEWRGGVAVLWSVQGDATAGAEDGGRSRRRRSSCRSARRKEEEEKEKEKGGMRGEPEVLFIKPGRTNDKCENRGDKKWISDDTGASISGKTVK